MNEWSLMVLNSQWFMVIDSWLWLLINGDKPANSCWIIHGDDSWWWMENWLNQHPSSPQVYKETLCWILADEWISMVQWSWWKIAGKKLWIGYVEHCRTNMNQPEPTWPNLSYSLIGNNGDSWWIHAHFLNSFKVPIINFASSQGRNVERTLASFCRRRMAWRTLAVCSSLAWPRGFHRRMGWWTPPWLWWFGNKVDLPQKHEVWCGKNTHVSRKIHDGVEKKLDFAKKDDCFTVKKKDLINKNRSVSLTKR